MVLGAETSNLRRYPLVVWVTKRTTSHAEARAKSVHGRSLQYAAQGQARIFTGAGAGRCRCDRRERAAVGGAAATPADRLRVPDTPLGIHRQRRPQDQGQAG